MYAVFSVERNQFVNFEGKIKLFKSEKEFTDWFEKNVIINDAYCHNSRFIIVTIVIYDFGGKRVIDIITDRNLKKIISASHSKDNEIKIDDERINLPKEARRQLFKYVAETPILYPDFEKRNGLVIAIIQDIKSRDVLMQGFMNSEAWDKTLQTGNVYFWSTSRNKLWLKGEESGNFFIVKEIYLDCDYDCVLIKVEVQGKGVACHTGERTCFYGQIF